ncbi:iron uptake system protein EfeO [Streptomyces sp. NPDC096132]|uniref:iron uptake system protein EfeO n=1 Tax=Streptomyces sp. NPDC096132 TaxID=3366075 RepID=UPI003830E7FF
MRAVKLSVVTAAAAAALTAFTGCAEKSDAKGSDHVIDVISTDSRCEISKKEIAAGHVELAIENKGSLVTAVYILFPDDRVLAERENVGPGTKQRVTAEVKAGDYQIGCRSGMNSDSARQDLKVTGGTAGKRDPRLDWAVATYRAYAQEQAYETLRLAETFATAVKDGDIEEARKTYALSRIGWEHTAPVADSFGDIGFKVDVREDGLRKSQDPATDWTGWHRLEKALWQDRRITGRDKQLADQLIADVSDWQSRIGKAEITATSMADGAKELLDEVATGMVTGEEEPYSHTDLVDFTANIEGAQKSSELLLKAVGQENDTALATELDNRFATLNAMFDKYRVNRTSYGFTSYDKLGEADRKQLSDAVNALAEPLSKLAATVAK